jgi:CubicO group peptidase (beta-lactamase class C family)
MSREKINLPLSSQELEATSPGFAMVVEGGKQSKEVSYGHFDNDDTELVTADTVYDIASVSKLFTTALILRQHEAGNISIHDPVGQYLSNFEHSSLTLIDLLSHRADFQVFLSEYRDQFPASDELTEALLSITPPTEPSQGIHYGNVNFIYLGKILEKVTGLDLNYQMHQLFKSLDLKNTYTGIDIVKRRIPVPATEIISGETIKGVVHDETARILGGLAGNAGIFSSANDLVLFGKAWIDNKIVSEQILHEAISVDYDRSNSSPQGLGWWLRYRNVANEEIASPNIPSSTGYTGAMLAINTVTHKVGAVTCNRTLYGRTNNQYRRLWAELIKELDS